MSEKAKKIGSKSVALVKKCVDSKAMENHVGRIDKAINLLVHRKNCEFDNEVVAASGGPIRFGIWIFLIVFVFAGLWSAIAPLDSAAIAPGTIVLGENKKVIQHLEGGIVSEILVKEGDSVVAGQALIKLNETNAKASLEILLGQFRVARAAADRLIAERDGIEKIEFDTYLLEKSDDPEVKKAIESQERLFESRRKAMNGQIAILRQRVKQLDDEIIGLKAQEKSANTQLDLINEEIKVVATLVESGKAVRPRLLGLQRKGAELEGNRGEFMARIARAKQGITETDLQIITLQDERQSEVVAQLRDFQTKVADLQERIRASQDILDRIVITAPQSGIVTGLVTHTVGGVIGAGTEIMSIIPQDDELIIEARVQPLDIDVVHNGLKARIRLSAFSVRSVPLIDGEVTYVSADRFIDQYTGLPYFLAKVSVDKEMLKKVGAGDIELYPGMMAEVLIVTGERTLLSYLLDPITSSFEKSFREQ